MVFLIQRAQNNDSLAIHLKLDELVAAHHGASNRLVSAEDLPEEDLERLQGEYRDLVRSAQSEPDPGCTHSIDEADVATAQRSAEPPSERGSRWARPRRSVRGRRPPHNRND
jgi:low affinity Fe/Cu permease